MLYVDGWDGMVIIGHRSFKSTFGANKCSDNKGCSCGELVHFCQLASTSLSPKSRPEKRWGGHQELPSFLQSSSKSLPFGSWVQPLPSAIVFASIFPYNSCCPYGKKIKYKKAVHKCVLYSQFIPFQRTLPKGVLRPILCRNILFWELVFALQQRWLREEVVFVWKSIQVANRHTCCQIRLCHLIACQSRSNQHC